MRNKSFLITISVVFWVVYVVLGSVQTYDNLHSVIEEEHERAKNRLEFVMSSTQIALLNENFDALTDTADSALEKGLIDFYVVQDSGKIIYSKHPSIDPQLLAGEFKVFDKVLVSGSYNFKAVKFMDYTYVVGFRFDESEWMWGMFKTIAFRYLLDLFLVTLALVLIVRFMLKDILQLSSALNNQSRSSLRFLNANSKEAKILLNATTTYENKTNQLASKNRTYEGSLGPAIVEEINSALPAPYSFESTMVRVDLNGYTQIFLSKNEEYITAILNEYFTQAREIISRYNGLIYQYVGDEIIFHIKGNSLDSQRLALGCVRSLFEAAASIEAALPQNAGHYFKIKASFVHAPIRFVKLDLSYALSGVSLIETARLLTQVDEKTTNMLAFSECGSNFYSELCSLHSVQEAQLKGFLGTRKICRVTEFSEIPLTTNLELVKYFRSDLDLIKIFAYVEEQVLKNNELNYMKIISQLRSLKIYDCSNELADQFLINLKSFVFLNQEGRLGDKVLASWISLCPSIIPAHRLTNTLAEELQALLEHPDSRIQANTIIVLGELAEDIEFLKKYISSPNNRVSADTLYSSGKRNLTKEICQTLLQHHNSKDPLFRASAAWVMTQLLKHYQANNEVFFNTSSYLTEFRTALATKQKSAS